MSFFLVLISVNTMGANILYVEDDPYLGLIITDFLQDKGFTVQYFSTAELGLNAFKENSADICVLDIGLPKNDGFWLAREIKKLEPNVPVIFLTAHKEKHDMIQGFDLGADDYIRKPFLPDELFLRIKAILNRVAKRQIAHRHVFTFKGFIFNYEKQTLRFTEREINLSHREAGLLKLFLENPNQVLTREFLLKEVWGRDDLSLSRSMDVYITKLRHHFKNYPEIKIINIRNLGFKFVIEEGE